jgi:hypothetical protein
MKFQVINLPFCFMPGYERFLAGDLAASSAAHGVRQQRDREPRGLPGRAPRPHRRLRAVSARAFCGGFYRLDDAPEPPWIVSAESLVRRVEP